MYQRGHPKPRPLIISDAGGKNQFTGALEGGNASVYYVMTFDVRPLCTRHCVLHGLMRVESDDGV